ncbi:pre-mRNA-splicing factor rbm22 like protein [Babesia gibsoni]|uniref:Pre-mRNA-splicing factor rbm22 like protein n=1 Tax=Babesia gibsoni TaxID=33632 RepID=A0AAD8UV85_BABGI|nr:pre-mRNA-splicing factor rbm22 like protein [Babesia gibsoni]
MEVNGHGIARDVRRLQSESSEFPTLCETCLGPNPLIRMQKERCAKECRICERPFTMFRWKPGPKARYKQTIICQNCSKIKNVCQTCLFDLEYGLPVQVRDEFLKNGIDLAESKANLNHQLSKLEKGTMELPSAGSNPMLEKLARVAPYYRRNKPRVCTFWLRNACNRGEECPYSHDNDDLKQRDPALAKQNIKDRFRGENDPVANKILNRLKEAKEKEEKDAQNAPLKDGLYPSMLPHEAQRRR